MVSGLTSWVRERLATAPAIYGLIVYEVLIVADSDEEDDPVAVLLVAVSSLLVFYLAHAFAESLAGHGRHRLGAAVRHGFVRSLGMLYAAVLPTLVLCICILAHLHADAASAWTLLAGLLTLVFLGYQAMAERGYTVGARLLGGLAAAVLGFVVMLLKYAVG